MEAIRYVEEASLSKEEKALYEKNWDRIRSEKTIITAAEEKGKIEGKIEIAKHLKQLGVGVEIIHKSTGLSHEEIDRL